MKYEDMNREDGEDIRRMYKRAENKVERLKILKELYPSYTKEAILAAAQHDPFRESDKFYEQITKEKTKMAQIQKYARETREAVVKDVLLNGMTQSEAAEKYGVNPKSVSYWCRVAKEKQQAFMDYAETVENEKKKTAADTERAVEDARPYAEITTGSASEPAECNLQTDDETRKEPSYSQRLEEYDAAVQKTADGENNNVEERKLTDLEWAERYVDIVIDNFKKAAELLIQMAYDDPDRVALEEKLKKELFRNKAERRKHNPDYNKLSIKAAAFDEICGIGAVYPDRSERELLFYINGIIGLAERLRGGNIWN